MLIDLGLLKWLIIHALYKSFLPYVQSTTLVKIGTWPPMLALARRSVTTSSFNPLETSTPVPPHNL